MKTKAEIYEARKLALSGMLLKDVSEKTGISLSTLARHGVTKTWQEKEIREVVISGKPLVITKKKRKRTKFKIEKELKEELEKEVEAKKVKNVVSHKREARIITERKEDVKRQKKLVFRSGDIPRGKPLKPGERKGAISSEPLDLAREAKNGGIVVSDLFDLWTYVVDSKKNKYFLTTEEGLFASSTLNIPFIDYQPAKRVYTVGKSIYAWRERNKSFVADSNFVKLNKPDAPLVPVKRHDVDTLNLTVGLPENNTDYQTTKEDAVIVSKEAAARFTFKYTKEIVLYSKPDFFINSLQHLKRGALKGCTDQQGNQIILTYEGTFKKTHESISENEKITVGAVFIERELQEGDKLTGLGGLKVVVGEIRESKDMSSDIIVAGKQLWNFTKKDGQFTKKDGQKGAMIKEFLTCGKIMVGLRQDTIVENQATRNKGASLSWKVYAALALKDMDTVKAIIRDNSRFNEMVLALHLEFDGNRFVLQSENDIEDLDTNKKWIKRPHYLYNKTQVDRAYQHETKPKGLSMQGIDFKERELFTGQKIPPSLDRVKNGRFLIWDYCYNPSFLPESYYNRKSRRTEKFPLHRKIPKDEKDTLAYRVTKGSALIPLAISAKEGKSQIYEQIEKQLFCSIRNGYYLVAIPQTSLPQNVIVINNRENFGFERNGEKWCLVIREPVCSFENIACVRILHDPELPDGVVRISLPLITSMRGDYDGDRIALIPYFSAPFIHNEKAREPEQKEFIELEVLMKKCELKERSTAELRSEAMAFMEQILYDKKKEGVVGNLIKRAHFSNPKAYQERILVEDNKISEVILKPELTKDLAQKKAYVSAAEERLEKLINEKMEAENGFIGLCEEFKGTYKRLLGFKPPSFWRPLFNVDKENELRGERTTSLPPGSSFIRGEPGSRSNLKLRRKNRKIRQRLIRGAHVK